MIVETPQRLEEGWPEVTSDVSGTGHVSTLPMDDEEKAAAKKRENRKAPLGFSALPPSKRKRR